MKRKQLRNNENGKFHKNFYLSYPFHCAPKHNRSFLTLLKVFYIIYQRKDEMTM